MNNDFKNRNPNMKSLINFTTALTLFLSFSITAHAAGALVYCSEGSPSAFNPQVFTDGTSSNASTKPIYNRLVDFEYGTTKIVPSLANKWNISKDGQTYTFIMRKGVKFHKTKYFTPTRDLNADDVVYTYNRMFKKSHPFHMIGGGTYEYFNGMDMGKIIKEIKKIGPMTVQIKLNQSEAPFLANLAMGFMSILSKEYMEKLIVDKKMENVDHYPVGTGPFMFKKYVKDSIIRYTSNDNYFLGAPKTKKLIFAITKDASVRYQKLKTGECHIIIEPAPSDLASMKSNKNLKVISGAGFNVAYLAMNVNKKPFDNKQVRQAISMALNKKAYMDAIYLGNGLIAKNPMPPSIWSYNKSIKDYSYNPKKAKALLAKAGFPKGFATELWTLPVTRPYNPNGKKMGEMMQADLAKIGVKIKLVTYDWSTYLEKSRKGEHTLIQMGWTGDNGDPDNFLNTLLGCSGANGGSNIANWCNQKFNRLVTDAKRISDKSKRTTLYKKAQTVFKEEAPWSTIAHSIIYRAMNKKVKGYKIDPQGHDIFTTVYVE